MQGQKGEFENAMKMQYRTNLADNPVCKTHTVVRPCEDCKSNTDNGELCHTCEVLAILAINNDQIELRLSQIKNTINTLEIEQNELKKLLAKNENLIEKIRKE